MQESFSQCAQNEDLPNTPCLDEPLAYWYEHISQEPFELQKQIKEAFFESGKIHLRIFDIEDSRCPSDVQCIWEGQVTVNVNVVINLEDRGNYNISLNDPLNLPIIQFDQYSLQLIKVEPYPTSTESIPVSDYIATMKLSMTEIISPLKQVNNGISPENIICKDGLELILKSSNNSPACVKPSTAEKLIERGWVINKIENTHNQKQLDISTTIPTSKIIELTLASPVEFVDDGREIQRSILQKAPAPEPMYDRIMDSMEDGMSVSSTGVASFTTSQHEKYSVNPGVGFYAEDWMPEYIPDGQKLLYTETTCYEQTGDCGLGIHFVPTTFVLHENVTDHDLQISKGFTIGITYSVLPFDEIEDIIEYLKEVLESQPRNFGLGFVEMTRDGKTVHAYEGGNALNHYRAVLTFHPDEHTSVSVLSYYHTLDELIPIFESIMQ